MSADQMMPGTVKLAKAAREDSDRLAAALVAVWDAERARMKVICEALEVEAPEIADPEPILWARRRAAELERPDWVAQARRQMDDAKRAARRQSGMPPADLRTDGTHAAPVEPGDVIAKNQALMARSSQAARHAQMATAGKAPGDASDAHRDTRKVRAEIYKRLAKESRT
jgi:hypothetical protein